MIRFLDLKRINARFEGEFQRVLTGMLEEGHYILGDAVAGFEKAFAAYCGVRHCVGVSNGLDGLRLIFEGYKVLGKLREGDEIIVPANTYIASILGVSLSGLVPVPVEPRGIDFNSSPEAIEKAITPRTRGVLAVHLYGQLADMEAISKVCEKNRLLLVEDAAQAHGAADAKGRKAGALGDAAAFSFYPTKNLGALGDAGAITTNDTELAEVVQKLRNYGRTEVRKHVLQGYNCRLDVLQAGFLGVKLPFLDSDNEARRAVARRYGREITNGAIQLPFYNGGANHVFYLFVVRSRERDRLQGFLRERGVETLIHYPVPPHRQPAYAVWRGMRLPVTEKIHEEVLSLPVSPVMDSAEIDRVITVVNSF